MPDQGQKTEQPTQQRLLKARRDGRLAASRDLVSAAQFIVLLFVAIRVWDSLSRGTVVLFRDLLRSAFRPQELDLTQIVFLYRQRVLVHFLHIIGAGCAVLAAVVLIHLVVTGFRISPKRLAPDFTRLNPLSRLRQLPKENIVNTLRGAVFLGAVGCLLVLLFRREFNGILMLAATNLSRGLRISAELFRHFMQQIAVVLAVVGAIDLFRERAKFTKQLRMSKQEVRDEIKESEGNMQSKLRIRRLQRDAARRNMIKAIPTATTIIVNPTHYAIALKYEMGSRSVPVLVAKGKNYLAQRIREKAIEHQIPIIENKPLAQALYQTVDVGQDIPPALYRAVAEVLAQIYRILNRS